MKVIKNDLNDKMQENIMLSNIIDSDQSIIICTTGANSSKALQSMHLQWSYYRTLHPFHGGFIFQLLSMLIKQNPVSLKHGMRLRQRPPTHRPCDLFR